MGPTISLQDTTEKASETNNKSRARRPGWQFGAILCCQRWQIRCSGRGAAQLLTDFSFYATILCSVETQNFYLPNIL